MTVPYRPNLHHDTQAEKSYKQVLVHDESDEEEKLTHIDSPSRFVDTLMIDMQQVRQGPLGTMSGIAKNLVALLGGHGYDRDLLIAYNPELEDLLMNKSMSQVSYDDLAEVEYLKTPAIYPSLKDFASVSLAEFIDHHPQIRDQIGDDQEVVIITRDDKKKAVTLYYDQGQIVFAQYSSPGKGGTQWDYDHGLKKKRLVDMHSPEGVLYTNRNIDTERYILQDNDETGEKDTVYYRDPHDRPNPTRRSRAFNSSMPYFIPVEASDKISGV